jgi:hypothetical protein
MDDFVRTFEVTFEHEGKVTSKWETKAPSLPSVVQQVGEGLAEVMRSEGCDAVRIIPKAWQ